MVCNVVGKGKISISLQNKFQVKIAPILGQMHVVAIGADPRLVCTRDTEVGWEGEGMENGRKMEGEGKGIEIYGGGDMEREQIL